MNPDYEKRRKQEEVRQIRRDLINYAKTEWGKKWIHSILKVGRPFRMQRGIQYVKDEERIENLRINKGQLFATVQGTAPTPYRVKVLFETIPEETWETIIEKLADKAINMVKLLEGEIPEEIITLFKDSNRPLFLEAEKGLNATCSCPDPEIPCKHIAATVLYIARVLDYDPFIILKLRGKTKEEVLAELSLSKETDGKDSIKEEKGFEFAFDVPKLSIKEIQEKEIRSRKSFDIGFKFRKPGERFETLENLGLPPNLENPKSFETVLGGIYKSITRQVYIEAT